MTGNKSFKRDVSWCLERYFIVLHKELTLWVLIFSQRIEVGILN